jgi:translation initiation factor IF-1
MEGIQMAKKKKGKKKKNPNQPEKKKKEEGLVLEGVITEALKGRFRIEIVEEGKQPDPENKGHEVIATLAGKLRTRFIKIVKGDRVKVELSPYDLTRGRITYRLKG